MVLDKLEQEMYMEFFRRHQWILKVLIAIASLALILGAILPYLILYQ